jgi:hypothetical protein
MACSDVAMSPWIKKTSQVAGGLCGLAAAVAFGHDYKRVGTALSMCAVVLATAAQWSQPTESRKAQTTKVRKADRH